MTKRKTAPSYSSYFMHSASRITAGAHHHLRTLHALHSTCARSHGRPLPPSANGLEKTRGLLASKALYVCSVASSAVDCHSLAVAIPACCLLDRTPCSRRIIRDMERHVPSEASKSHIRVILRAAENRAEGAFEAMRFDADLNSFQTWVSTSAVVSMLHVFFFWRGE